MPRLILVALLFCGALATKEGGPVISLDLDGEDLVQYSTSKAGVACNAGASTGPLCRERRGAGSREDFAKSCIAGQVDSKSCPLPTAMAYDSHEGNLDVKQRIYLVNNDGKSGDLTQTYTKIDYSIRSGIKSLYYINTY